MYVCLTSKYNVSKVQNSGYHTPNVHHLIFSEVEDLHSPMNDGKVLFVTKNPPISVVGQVTLHTVTLEVRGQRSGGLQELVLD